MSSVDLNGGLYVAVSPCHPAPGRESRSAAPTSAGGPLRSPVSRSAPPMSSAGLMSCREAIICPGQIIDISQSTVVISVNSTELSRTPIMRFNAIQDKPAAVRGRTSDGAAHRRASVGHHRVAIGFTAVLATPEGRSGKRRRTRHRRGKPGDRSSSRPGPRPARQGATARGAAPAPVHRTPAVLHCSATR